MGGYVCGRVGYSLFVERSIDMMVLYVYEKWRCEEEVDCIMHNTGLPAAVAFGTAGGCQGDHEKYLLTCIR